MDKNENKILAEKAFWNVWGNLESNSAKNGTFVVMTRTMPQELPNNKPKRNERKTLS
jgi:hypothetical protein